MLEQVKSIQVVTITKAAAKPTSTEGLRSILFLSPYRLLQDPADSLEWRSILNSDVMDCRR